MRGVNKVIIVGTLGRDPEEHITSGGSVVSNFSVAVNEGRKNKDTGEWEQTTEWIRIVLFGKQAEYANQYLKKGSRAYIEGRIKTEKYQDKKTGEDKYTTKVWGYAVQGLDKAPEREQGADDEDERPQRRQQQAPQQGGTDPEFDDDIPF